MHAAATAPRPLPPLSRAASPLQALSELQRENSGLRAACVTLGRELLSLKAEFGAFQQQTAVALAAVSPAAAALLAGQEPPAQLPSAAEAAPEAEAQQAYASYAGDEPTDELRLYPPHLELGHAEAEAPQQQLAAEPPLPVRLPTAAPPAAPAVAPALAMPPGQIVLAGGHDGGTWLDSVGGSDPFGALGGCVE
jgi:hypothetical protein